MAEILSFPNSVLIAGGTKGIGLGIALKFSRPGAKVFLSYSSDDQAAKLASDLVVERGATPYLIKENIGSKSGGVEVIRRVSEHSSYLDVIVHSAAVPNPGFLAEQPIDEIVEAVEIGGMALLYLVQPAMKLLKSGSSVIFLSGVSTYLVLPKHGALAGAKALGECFAKYLAIECATKGINFNTLSVGPVDTELFRSVRGNTVDGQPIPPPLTPNGLRLNTDNIAEVADFLVSNAGKMIRGQTILVDGGLSTTVRSS